jgi:hypothetical protein
MEAAKLKKYGCRGVTVLLIPFSSEVALLDGVDGRAFYRKLVIQRIDAKDNPNEKGLFSSFSRRLQPWFAHPEK